MHAPQRAIIASIDHRLKVMDAREPIHQGRELLGRETLGLGSVHVLHRALPVTIDAIELPARHPKERITRTTRTGTVGDFGRLAIEVCIWVSI